MGVYGNCGLHNEKSLNKELRINDKFYIKGRINKVNLRNELKNGKIIAYIRNESICSIKKQYLKHWLFYQCSQDKEFLTYGNFTWAPHYVPFLNDKKAFEVLASGDFGPQVIQYIQADIIATFFEIDDIYKKTTQILRNFIQYKIKNTTQYMENKYPTSKVQSNEEIIANKFIHIFDRIDKSKSEQMAYHCNKKLQKQIKYYPPTIKSHQANEAQFNSNEYQTNQFTISSSKNEGLNSIIKQQQQLQKNEKSDESKMFIDFKNEPIIQRSYSARPNWNYFSKQNLISQSSANFLDAKSNSRSITNLKNLSSNQNKILSKSFFSILKNKSNLQKRNEKQMIKQSEESKEKLGENINDLLSHSMQIRNQLHPTIKQHSLLSKDLWAPGFLSFRKLLHDYKKSAQSKIKIIQNSDKKYKISQNL